MNNTFKRITALSATTLALGFGAVAMTSGSASAQSIKAHGTVSSKENNKIHSGVKNQYCLTVKETQKIVGTKGHYENYGDGMTERTFKGTKGSSVKTVNVDFAGGCADLVYTAYTKDRTRETYNGKVWDRYFVNHPDCCLWND